MSEEKYPTPENCYLAYRQAKQERKERAEKRKQERNREIEEIVAEKITEIDRILELGCVPFEVSGTFEVIRKLKLHYSRLGWSCSTVYFTTSYLTIDFPGPIRRFWNKIKLFFAQIFSKKDSFLFPKRNSHYRD